jgi:hypothetical protein
MLEIERILLEDTWKDDSSCKYRTDLFFSTGAVNLFEARKICYECPVFNDCLEWTLSHQGLLEDGIFAGFDKDQRHDMARRGVPFVDWREDFHPDRICERHTEEDMVFVHRGHNGEKYYICMKCGARIKRLGRNS